MLYDHVDFRVADLAAARPLYDALLPAMGYSKINADADSRGYHSPDEMGAQAFFWLVEDRAHVPGLTRIAFAAGSREDVDRLSLLARESGARCFEAPQLVPEYGATYYAAFFEDAEGNKLEICCRRR